MWIAKEYYISTFSLNRSASPELHGQDSDNNRTLSLTDKLTAKVNSIKKLKKTYPYILRTIVVAAIFVLLSATYNSEDGSTTFNANATGLSANEAAPAIIDDVTEREVSVLVAQLADIVETEEVQKDALSSAVAYEPETTLVAKNQVVETDTVTRADIVEHKVADGESLTDIAKNYGITTDTIKWANDISGDTVAAGDKLVILPVDGVMHTVKEGDTVRAIADRYEAEADAIIAFNDAEIDGLVLDQKIVIPNGTQPAPEPTRLLNAYTANVAYNAGAQSSGRSYTYLMHYSAYSNPYPYFRGWCTDWASYRADQLGNPLSSSSWGNAISWDSNAAAAGYYVGPVPKVGAVLQSDRGSQGHVGVVEEVSSDGTMIKYSDMNGLAGWGNAAKTNDWVSASYYEYIYR